MNKLRLLLPLLFGPLFLFSQIIIDDDDMPQEGDTIRLSTSIDLGMLNYEETGTDFLWDFSNLTAFSQNVDTFVSVQQTPWVYQVVFFLSSNLAQPMQSFDQIPGFEVTEAYEFLKNSSNDYRSTGYGVTLSGIPIPNKFDEPDIIYQFPVEYGNVDSSMSEHEIDIPALGYLGGWKKRVNQVDGWGTLMTPYGSFETIRVKSEILQFDSIYIDSLGFGIPILRNITEYKWLGDGFGLPLCTATDDGLLPTINYIDSVRTLFVSQLEFFSEDLGIQVYPNPTMDNITIDLYLEKPSEIEVTLRTISGRTIFESLNFRNKSGKVSKCISMEQYNLREGTYIMHIRIDDKDFVRKIIYQ